MEAEDVPARATRAGERIRAGAEPLDGVAGVRGMGLLLAVELEGHESKVVAGRLLELGAIVNAVTPTALRLAPSLLISDDEVDLAVDLLGKALA
jgi:acetylornithine aminotransferase